MQLIQRGNKKCKLREILELSVYFPSTPSKLKVQVFVLLFLVTLFISPSITMGVACPLSLV